MILFELTTSIAFLVSVFSNNMIDASSSPIVMADVVSITAPMTLEDHVREYFADTPILAEIARCESTFKQIGTNGKIIRGKVNSSDIGIMQINEYYHKAKATSLGYDLYTLEGNLAYGQYLYDKEGSRPWNSSSKCWSKTINKELAVK